MNADFAYTIGIEKYLLIIVVTTSKHTNGSFWKTFTNGKTNNGRNFTSVNIEDQ
jgi:hypothetical protein